MQRRTMVRIAVMLLLAAVVLGIYLSPLREQLTRDNVRGLVEQLRGLWYGPLVFIAAFMLACILALPASLFILAAGAIYGWVLGGTYSVIGGMLGAVASFYVGRFMGEGMLDRFGRVGRAVARQVDHANFGSLLAFRFIPGVPFAVLNYGAGVAGVRVRDFVAATLVSAIPQMFIFAYCADALFNGTMREEDAAKRLLIVAVLLLTVTLVPMAARRVARRRAGATE